MARRGAQLREHILRTAKTLFLESGFERTSMDAVAARAETSKRSLYAHFPSKDALFAGIVELSRELYLEQIGVPDGDLADPVEAAARYCGRLLQVLLWTTSVQSLRMGIAEAERVPGLAAGYYESVFEMPTARLGEFLERRTVLAPATATATARALIAQTTHPDLLGCLLGVRPALPRRPDPATLEDDVDLDRIRAVAASLLPRGS